MELTFFDRLKWQIYKEIQNRAELTVIRKRFENWYKNGDNFSLEGDKKLNEEQIAEINKFWNRYKFAYPKINYKAFEAYMNRTGKFDCRYLPAGIRTIFIAPYFQNKQYYWPWQNKALLSRTFPNIKQPETIIRRINGYYYDGDYNRINLNIAIEKCLQHLRENKSLILKPNESGGGRGIKFIQAGTSLMLKRLFTNLGLTFVVQDVLKQHSDMCKLNPNSVNTLRITSIIWENKVEIISAAVRIGTGEKHVDNWNAGGIIVGIDPKGILYPFGLNKKCEKHNVTFGGVELNKGFAIPNYNDAIEAVKKAHVNIPYIKFASWDIAIDENGEPNLIEVNFAGDMAVHQLTVGPAFGDLTKDVLDKAILENYYKKHSTINFDYREYYNHVEVELYVGNSKNITIPAKKYGKPVTVIRSRAFRLNKNIEKVNLPVTIKRIGERAFSGCINLKDININKNIVVHSTAFIQCPCGQEIKMKK